MRRLAALDAVLLLLIMETVFVGCGGGGAAGPVASITLTPTAVSLNRGATAQVTAQAEDANHVAVGTPALAYSSDNPAITVSNNGLICAGQWDANFTRCFPCSNPLASNLCTAPPGPGPNDSNLLPLGTASITATSTATSQTNQTITSSAVVVNDHEPIDSVQIVPSPGNPPGCVSQNGVPSTAQFTAQAFSHDPAACLRIYASPVVPCQVPSSTIGSVNWQISPSQVATADATIHTATNPVTVTAASPGQGVVAGSVGVGGSTVSGSAPFATCAVSSIHVQKSSTDTSTSFTAPVSATVILAPIVTDSKGFALDPASSIFSLTWLTSQPALALVTVGAVGARAPGTAEITAACLPPTCNVGFIPPQPVFSDNVVTATFTAKTVDSTVLVTSSTGPNCSAAAACSNSNLIVPIDTGTNNPGAAFTLPAGVQVNSMVLTPIGDPAFLGTVCSNGTTGPNGAACSGLLRFDPTVATVAAPVPTITGTVLATDGTRVVLSDPTNNQTIIAAASGPVLEKVLPISNATAAAFAIDGSKIYIVAGSKLFVYSPGLPLESINLNGSAGPSSQTVAFFATGAMAYAADSAGDDVIATCSDAIQGTVSVPHPPGPTHIAAVPNATAMVAANSPNIDEIDATANSAATNGICPPLITNPFVSHSFPVSFTAKQLIVTPDSKLAIILTSDQGVLVYNIGSQPPQTSVIQLSGGAPTPEPLSGGVTPDSATLYVGANDGKVHRVDLTKTPFTDAQNPITVNLCPSVAAGCNPDFLVVKPVATVATLKSLAVKPVNPTLSVGATQQFTATGTFSDNTTRDMTDFVTWSSSTVNVAVIGPITSVNPPITTPGLAQALATGTTTITATSAGITGSTTLTVK